jgi:hypothetical protein
MFVICALSWFYKRILLRVVIIILNCNGIFLGNTAANIWGTLHYVILNSTFCYPVSSVNGIFVNIFFKIKLKLVDTSHEAENKCLWLKHFSYKFLNLATINAGKHKTFLPTKRFRAFRNKLLGDLV